jgi:hypothetical protein
MLGGITLHFGCKKVISPSDSPGRLSSFRLFVPRMQVGITPLITGWSQVRILAAVNSWTA